MKPGQQILYNGQTAIAVSFPYTVARTLNDSIPEPYEAVRCMINGSVQELMISQLTLTEEETKNDNDTGFEPKPHRETIAVGASAIQGTAD